MEVALKYGLFEQRGTILCTDECVLTLAFEGLKFSLAKDSLYISNLNCTDEEWRALSEGDLIYFDALPCLKRRNSKALPKATCGWMGSLPHLTQRFPFRFGVNELPSNLVLAPVVAFPEPDIAVCHINLSSSNTLCIIRKEMLCDENGSCCPDVKTLQDALSVGDLVALHSNDINCEGNNFWFSAWNGKLIENCYSTVSECGGNRSLYTTSVGTSSLEKVHQEPELSETDSYCGKDIYSESGECGFFSHLESSYVGLLLYKGHKVRFHKKNCFFERINWDNLHGKEMQNMCLKFEAIKCSVSYPTLYEALWVWDTIKKPSTREMLNRLNNNTYRLPETSTFHGIVSTYALPNVAFVNINEEGVNCYAPMRAMIKSKIKNSKKSSKLPFTKIPIYESFKVGSIIEVKKSSKNVYVSCVKLEVDLPVSSKFDLCLEPQKNKIKNNSETCNAAVKKRFVQYADGLGKLAIKLSADEAIFYVKKYVPGLEPQRPKWYAVFIKRFNVYCSGTECRNWDDIHESKEFRVLSKFTKDLSDRAIKCGASQEGICATDSDVLDACKKKCNLPVDETLEYIGKVEQYLTFNTAVVACEILNHTCRVLLNSYDLIDAPKLKSSRSFKIFFIGRHLAVGDHVTMKVYVEAHRCGYIFKSCDAKKGLPEKNMYFPSPSQRELVTLCANGVRKSSNNLVLSSYHTNSFSYDNKDILPIPTPKYGHEVYSPDTPCGFENKNISLCFSRLLHMSGTVKEICSNFEGVILVDVLKICVQFHLSNMVFRDDQDDERDKILPDLTPIGTCLMFSATKVHLSRGDIFRATKVWKPICRPN